MEKIAELQVLIGAQISGFESGMNKVESRLTSVGNSIGKFGASVTMLTAPLAEGLNQSVKAAVSFDSEMHNIAAVTGTTGPKLDTLSKQIRQIGTDSRYGAEQAAQAFYDIAGSTTDASVRIPLLTQAIHTAQAGQADLMGTTKALTSVMNAYGLKASDVTYVSDVLTQTVALGVGTMDQFAAALPKVTGTANMLGIKFHKVGAMAAYLTTKGFTASQSMTMLSSMMNALLKPNKTMESALKAIGYESGKAAVENLGLLGTYEKLINAGYGDEVAKITGRIEAFRGVTALTQKDADKFLTTFSEGVKGATKSAEGLQMTSFAAQSDLLRSQLENLAIVIGNALLPVLNKVVASIMPIVSSIAAWIEKNPAAAQTILEIVAAVTLIGPPLMVAGMAMSAFGTIVGGLTTAAGLLVPALGLIVAPLLVVGGLFYAYQNNVLGFRDRLNELGNTLRNNVFPAIVDVSRALVLNFASAVSQAESFLAPFLLKINEMIEKITGVKTALNPQLQPLANDVFNKAMMNAIPESPDLLGGAMGGGGSSRRRSFAVGGYTGDQSGAAGIVHGREYVVPENGALVMRGGGGPQTIHLIADFGDAVKHIYFNVGEAINRGNAMPLRRMG